MPLYSATPPPRRGIPGLFAALCFVLGPVLAWLRLVPPLTGFGVFALAGLAGLVIGIRTAVRALRGRSFTRGGLVALVVGVAFVVIAARGMGTPRINDFTTDLDDPPAFRNAATLPANAGRDLTYPAAFAVVQRGCCPDLHPARLRGGTEEVFARARQVADSMHWTITAAEPAAGTIEATAQSRLFGFVDDIVIRVRPDGGASRVDVRSKSRDGKGDLGTNAARIRRYIDALEAIATDRP